MREFAFFLAWWSLFSIISQRNQNESKPSFKTQDGPNILTGRIRELMLPTVPGLSTYKYTLQTCHGHVTYKKRYNQVHNNQHGLKWGVYFVCVEFFVWRACIHCEDTPTSVSHTVQRSLTSCELIMFTTDVLRHTLVLSWYSVFLTLTCSPVLFSDVRGRLDERELSEAPDLDGGRLERTGDSVWSLSDRLDPAATRAQKKEKAEPI